MLTRTRTQSRRRDERGLSLVLMSLLLTGLLAMAGLVVDLGSWQVEASRIQQAADAASLAAVVRLPDGEPAATARAIEVARDNGFDNADADVTVSTRVLGGETIEVTVTKTNVSQYFTRVVRGDTNPTITRRSTAQYVQPVPLGSPRNYLGTNQLLASGPNATSGDGIENFYLAVSGECTRREYGDRITGIAMNNQSSPHSCNPGTGGTLANPEATTDGYLFTVTVPDVAGSTPVAVQMFDAPTCTNSGAANLIFGEQATPHGTTVTVRRFDDLDPLAGSEADVPAPGYTASPIPTPQFFEGQNSTTGQCRFGVANSSDLTCGPEVPFVSGLRECWTTLAVLSTPGQYTIQVNPATPPAARNQNTRHNVFSLRAKTGLVFDPCTSDPIAGTIPEVPATPPYSAACTQISGLEHLPIYARGNDSPVFYLASIDSRHNGKTMQVTLYDAAEGASTISLLNPLGGTEDFTWEVLCADGAAPSTGCAGEVAPDGGRTGGPTSAIPVAGTGTQPFTNNVQNGLYSDRLLRLTLKMPDDIDAAYNGATWWKIQYGGAFTGDRTTWSVRLLGDPVRLLPNAPTTTTTTPGP